MTCTSPTLRHMSRIYLDLKSIHCQTISGLNPDQFDRPVPTMPEETRVSQHLTDYMYACHRCTAGRLRITPCRPLPNATYFSTTSSPPTAWGLSGTV